MVWRDDPRESIPWGCVIMVTCADCGLLGIVYLVNKQWFHADQRYRSSGLAEDVAPGLVAHYPARCFALAFNLEQERVGWETAGQDFALATTTVLQWPRDCPEWIKWRNGFSPKEHAEMLDRQRLLDWQAKREDADRDWRERQRGLDLEARDDERKWREAQDARARSTKLVEIALTAALTMLSIVLASFFVIKAANIQSDAQLRSTEMQINALKAATPPPSPPINE